jgi:hypothetical protein
VRFAGVQEETASARRGFRAVIESEHGAWRDKTYRRLIEEHLEPLLKEADRFEYELSATSHAVGVARRRLSGGG